MEEEELGFDFDSMFGGGETTTQDFGDLGSNQPSILDEAFGGQTVKEDPIEDDGIRRDEEGEEYQLPEALEWFEDTWIGDVVQDLVLYGKQGLNQRRVAAESAELLTGAYDNEDVIEYIEAVGSMNEQEQTAEMNEFNKQIEENGGGFWGVIKATASNPTAAMGIMVSSLVSMTTPEAIGAAGTVYGTGLAAGSAGGPIGTGIAAILGAPAAVGTMSAITDATLTFSDYLQTEIRERGLEFNEKNVNALLNDKEVISGLRTAAAARGVAIGLIDGLTLKLGGMLTKTLRGAGIGKATTAIAATGLEATGGGVGELGGQVAEIATGTREEIDTTEIALESIAEIAGPGTAVQVAKATKEVATGEATGQETETETTEEELPADIESEIENAINELDSEGTGSIIEGLNEEALNDAPDAPKYTLGKNNAPVTKQEVSNWVENATDEQLASMGGNINVINDDKTAAWIGDKIQRAKVRMSLPDNVPSADRIVDLEVGLNKYKDNDSVVGKARTAEINRRIRNLAAGKPEMDGIITEATDTQPAKNNSVIPEGDTFSAVENPNPQVDLSVEERGFGQGKKNENPNFIGELSAKDSKLSFDKTKGENYQTGLKKQINNITGAIKNLKLKGEEFFAINGGTSPTNLAMTKKIANAYGFEVSQHPLNPGEFLVHKPGKRAALRSTLKYDGGLYGLKGAAQFFTDSVSKSGNAGVNPAKVRAWLAEEGNRVTGQRTGLIQDVNTLNNDDLNTLVSTLEEKYDNVRVFSIEGKRGKYIEFYNQSQVDASINEARSRESAPKSYLNKAVKVLKKAFPGVDIVFEYEDYFKAIRELRERGVNIPDGAKGILFEGKVYLNPLAVTKDTPFHEFAHIWAKALLRNNPTLWKKGVELLKGTEYMRIVDSIPYYNNFKKSEPARFYEEVMANALGKRAADLFSAAELPKWKQFLQEFTDWLKYKLNIASQNAYADLTLDHWLDIGAKSILSGDQTAFDQLPDHVKDKLGLSPYVDASLPEGLPDSINEKDIANAKYNMNKKHKGWRKDPKMQEVFKQELIKVSQRRVNKETANTTKKPVEAIAPALNNKTFKAVVNMFEKFIERDANSISKSNGSIIREISTERLARSLGKMFQDFESGDVSVQQFYSAAGKRAYPRKPSDMTKDEFKQAQLGVGSIMLEYMIENGYLDLNFHYGQYQAVRDQAKKNKGKIPPDAGYVVEITNLDAVNELADAVAINPSTKPDFKEVYVGDQKPMKQDKFVGKDGLQIISRDNETNKITRESHPKVFQVKDKADNTDYVVNEEYVGYLEQIQAKGLLAEGVGASLESKERMLKTSILNLKRLGQQVFRSAHNFVHNGRLMNTSTDVSHQSSKNVLAAYSFAQKEPMGEKGWEYTKVLTQDTYGYSGTGDTWTDRLNAAEKNTKKWMEVAADPMGNLDYIMKADVPMLFLRHILEMKAAIDSGDPTTFKSGLPAHMDATTSGIQFLAAATKDPNAARIANLTKTDERFDSYSNVVVEVLLNRLGELPANSSKILAEFNKRQAKITEMAAEASAIEDDNARAEAWEKFNVANEEFKAWKAENKDVAAQAFWFQKGVKEKFRKIFKGPVMTKYYSSKQGGMSDALMADFKDKFPGLNKTFTSWLAGHITKAADSVFDGPGRVLGVAQEIAKDIVAADQVVTFENPVTGFKVVNDPRVEKPGTIQLKYKGNNAYIKERNKTGKIKSKIAYDSEEKNLNKQKSQIAPLIVHSLDAALVHYVYLNADFPVQTIHDSFATSPAHADKLYKLVREGFYEITKGDILLDIFEQIYKNAGFADWKSLAKEKFDRTQVGGLDMSGVLTNQYAFSAGVTDPDVADKTIAKARLKQQPALSLAENFEAQITDEAIGLEADKIETEAKPCK